MFSQDLYVKTLEYISQVYKKEENFDTLSFLNNITCITMEVIHACQESNFDDEKSNLAISSALLYGILENSQKTYDDLYVDFSEDIANAVESLNFDISSSTNKELQNTLEMLLSQPYEVQMVKLAVRVTNLVRFFDSWNESEKEKYLKDSSFILSCLKNSNIYLSQRLEEKINFYKSK